MKRIRLENNSSNDIIRQNTEDAAISKTTASRHPNGAIFYTDEKIAAEDLKSGACDAAGITGLRAREFNSFTGTLDSIGAIPDESHMRVVLQYLADPKLAKLMVSSATNWRVRLRLVIFLLLSSSGVPRERRGPA